MLFGGQNCLHSILTGHKRNREKAERNTYQRGSTSVFLGTKPYTRVLCDFKNNIFWPNFPSIFYLFFPLLSFLAQKLIMAYFFQSFECAAPKCWLKYTTNELC